MIRFGIVANLDKQDVRRLVPNVLNWLQQQKIPYSVDEELAESLDMSNDLTPSFGGDAIEKQCDMILSFGGDGTILSTARKVAKSGVPILGVKIGGMGFLAESFPENLHSHIREIVNGQYDLVERVVLEAELESNNRKRTYFALNDCVVDKGATSRVIRIKTYIDDEYLNTYIGDGLIIATPTGSTAYSLAVGGPILLPSMNAIIINPISPHSLGARPVVIPGDKRVQIVIESAPEEVPFSADGRVEEQLKPGDTVNFHIADHRIKLVSPKGRSFYDILRAKLSWGEDVRRNNA